MGKIHILTKEQQVILDEVKRSKEFRQFYFTGGTALSECYLQHRYSEDLDFFSNEKLDTEKIFIIASSWSKQHNFTFRSEFKEVVYTFFLEFNNGKELKLDFGYYPYKQIEKPNEISGMKTDSLKDIAVNKLLTTTQRSAVKDFVDLYFLLRHFSLWDLIYGLELKFSTKTDPLILASDFLKVEDFSFLPLMIKPLKIEGLKSFFRKRAHDLGGKAFK